VSVIWQLASEILENAAQKYDFYIKLLEIGSTLKARNFDTARCGQPLFKSKIFTEPIHIFRAKTQRRKVFFLIDNQ